MYDRLYKAESNMNTSKAYFCLAVTKPKRLPNRTSRICSGVYDIFLRAGDILETDDAKAMVNINLYIDTSNPTANMW